MPVPPGTQTAGRAVGAQPPARLFHLPGDTQHPGARSRQGLNPENDSLPVPTTAGTACRLLGRDPRLSQVVWSMVN